ncbi:hypothetical protein GQ457_HM000760 [Hibiscus cannabinus]
MEQQRVVIPNKHGEKLVGLLHETGSKEIVILCHGFRSTKADRTMVTLAAAFRERRNHSLPFRLCRKWLPRFRESEGSFEFGNYLREADDLHSVIRHFFEANRVVSAIVGHSKGEWIDLGGGVVLVYASKYDDINTVVNVSGRYDLKKGIEERFGKDFMERIEDGIC